MMIRTNLPLLDAGKMMELTVDTAHLLSNHDRGGSVVGATDPRDREAVPHPLEVTGALRLTKLLLVENVRVVVVAGRNDGMVAQPTHGAEAFGNMTLFHEPTRRLGAEEDSQSQEEGGNERRTQLETPGNVTRVLDDDVGGESQEDSCRASISIRCAGRRGDWENLPTTTQSCQNMTRAPRIRAGAISAE